jgi:hypothetical protein
VPIAPQHTIKLVGMVGRCPPQNQVLQPGSGSWATVAAMSSK